MNADEWAASAVTLDQAVSLLALTRADRVGLLTATSLLREFRLRADLRHVRENLGMPLDI